MILATHTHKQSEQKSRGVRKEIRRQIRFYTRSKECAVDNKVYLIHCECALQWMRNSSRERRWSTNEKKERERKKNEENIVLPRRRRQPPSINRIWIHSACIGRSVRLIPTCSPVLLKIQQRAEKKPNITVRTTQTRTQIRQWNERKENNFGVVSTRPAAAEWNENKKKIFI